MKDPVVVNAVLGGVFLVWMLFMLVMASAAIRAAKGNEMASIPRREDIVKKLERSESSELQAVSDSVAAVLTNAKSLPVHFSGSGLGSTEGVRRAIIQRLKEAGWVVRQLDEQQMGDTKWSVS